MAERVSKTLKEQLLWARCFPTVEAIRTGLTDFADLYNASWLRERHGHKTPDQSKGEQKALASEAATEFKLATQPAQQTVSQPFPDTHLTEHSETNAVHLLARGNKRPSHSKTADAEPVQRNDEALTYWISPPPSSTKLRPATIDRSQTLFAQSLE